MAKRIQLRRDIKANWEALNPILAQGEVGVDLTNNNIKIGDGINRWNSMAYTIALGKLSSEFNENTFILLGPITNPNRVTISNNGIETLVLDPNLMAIHVKTLFDANIESTDILTGTVVVTGGVGVSGNLNVGGTLSADNIQVNAAIEANIEGNVTGDVFGNLIGDVYSDNGVKILENGTNGTNAQCIGQ